MLTGLYGDKEAAVITLHCYWPLNPQQHTCKVCCCVSCVTKVECDLKASSLLLEVQLKWVAAAHTNHITLLVRSLLSTYDSYASINTLRI
jgi:hypothetical protein